MIPEQTIGEYRVKYVAGYAHLCKGDSELWCDKNDVQSRILRLLTGHVLLSGLGLGWLAEHTLSKVDVKSVTVIEISQEIIDMVSPYIDNKIVIIQGDIKTILLSPFDSCYIDIAIDATQKLRVKLKQLIAKVYFLSEIGK